jgi:predicted NAD-dependent protein-ADP-ribosyltransferase YbiA (DUF1768 family)
MSYSNLNKSILYAESRGLNPNDLGHESTLYEINIFDSWVQVILGKINTSFSAKEVVYYPIYLLDGKKKIRAQIGVFEIHSNKTLEIIDEDGDVDISKMGNPVLYTFVTAEYINKDKSTDLVSPTSVKPVHSVIEVDESDYKDTNDDEQDDDIATLKPASYSKQTERAVESIKDGVFIYDKHAKPPVLLTEETEKEAAAIKKEYRESSHSTWISKFMKNDHFGIHAVEANGDCFFAVIRDAFKQIGQITTVEKLRSIVAKEVTDSVFQEHRTLFLSLDGMVKEKDRELKSLKNTLEKVYKQRALKAKSQGDAIGLSNILKETEEAKAQYKQLQIDKRDTEALIDENVGSFSEIDTIDKFREFIQTTKFWADSWAISVLERELDIKMIILSERSYKEGALDSVMVCGEISKELQESGVTIKPKYYIMTTFSGDHFKLITYKDKRIFQFHEIPYYVKNLIINKCIEKNAGPFYAIQAFRDLRSKLGLDRDEVNKVDEEQELAYTNNDLFDPNIVFMFHSKSDKSPKPGKGSNEKIPSDKLELFKDLGRIPDWRRKLDDSWTDVVFSLDGHKWSSVEHYYQGAKFKNGFPDFTLQFSLDSDSEISKSVELARAAGGLSGKRKSKLLRPTKIVIDPNFYGERNESERETALLAKFSQNQDMKALLLATRTAKLIQFIRGEPAVSDDALMKVRREIS